MLKRFDIPDYQPDQPLFGPGGNVIALPNGFRPAPSASPVTPALTGILGAGSFRSIEGNQALIAGTGTALYQYTGGAWSSVLGSLSATVWRFAQFGDNLICANGGTPITYNLAANTAAVTAGSPPTSDIVATVRDFVMLAGDPSATNQLTISGYNDSTNWSGGLNQQLTNSFPTGGAIMGIAGGPNGVILSEAVVRLATYVGGTVVWQFDEISQDIGCMAKGGIVQAGQLVFFLSDHGFMMCDRTAVSPIGQEVVDRTFFATYSRDEIKDNLRAAYDPKTTEIVWSMPGTPGAIWRYNYMLKKWSPPSYTSMSFVFPGYSQSYTLESLNALYPSGLETIPLSLDASKWAGGAPALYVADAAGVVNTMTGPPLAAFYTFYPIEIEPGRRVRVKYCRVVGDMTSGTVSLDVRARDGDPSVFIVSGAIRDNGRVPIRANGRHFGMRIDVPAGADWSYMASLDVDYELEGQR